METVAMTPAAMRQALRAAVQRRAGMRQALRAAVQQRAGWTWIRQHGGYALFQMRAADGAPGTAESLTVRVKKTEHDEPEYAGHEFVFEAEYLHPRSTALNTWPHLDTDIDFQDLAVMLPQCENWMADRLPGLQPLSGTGRAR